MGNKHATLTSLFTAIADAIRSKTGDTGVIVADDFPDVINALSIGTEAEAMTFETIWSICGYGPGGLPAGYTLLEYIESSGTQYIDTGFTPNQDTSVVCRAVVPIGDTNWLYGTRYSGTSRQFNFVASVNGYYLFGYNTAQTGFTTAVSSSGIITVEHNKQSVTITTDSATETKSTTYAAFTAPTTMLLFANSTNGTIGYGKVKIYSCKIYDNGTLVRNYVPCINPDGVYGLYDRANSKFYGSEGGLITADNISQFFTVTNSSYYFKGSGSVFTTNNKGVNSSTAKTTLTAKQDMDVSFAYSWSSESNYDKFTLTFAGTTIESNKSGSTTTKTYSGHLTAGQTIVFQYTKDSSSAQNDDKCTFSDMRVPTAFTGA